MRFWALILIFLTCTDLTFARGRSPAVEDFVGIEMDQPHTIPRGSESLYNLEKDMGQLEQIEAAAYIASSEKVPAPKEHTMNGPDTYQWNLTNTLAVLLILGMPLLSWFMAMNHLRRKATLESATNVEVLEKYRKERELARKNAEEFKKVS